MSFHSHLVEELSDESSPVSRLLIQSSVPGAFLKDVLEPDILCELVKQVDQESFVARLGVARVQSHHVRNNVGL